MVVLAVLPVLVASADTAADAAQAPAADEASTDDPSRRASEPTETPPEFMGDLAAKGAPPADGLR